MQRCRKERTKSVREPVARTDRRIRQRNHLQGLPVAVNFIKDALKGAFPEDAFDVFHSCLVVTLAKRTFPTVGYVADVVDRDAKAIRHELREKFAPRAASLPVED
jgi:hypothetical protein